MASAALMSSGSVQSLCRSCSSAKIWQPKRLLFSRSALTGASPHGKADKASIQSSISFRPLDSVFGRLRRSGLGSETRSGSSRHMSTAAGEGSISVDETQSSAPGNFSESSEESAEFVPPPERVERFQPRIPSQRVRREDPTVPTEALVEGAVFTGRVTAIQPFGAFVNFGAFRDGLVHISKLSTGYVRNVSEIVNVGQEVKVTILNVDHSASRIALSMVDNAEKEGAARTGDSREGSDRFRFQQGLDSRSVNRGGGWQNRRDEPPEKPFTKLSEGQEIEGTVKNRIRSGVFVELPEYEEGFLRYSDTTGGENMAFESSLQTGEKVRVTVLSTDRGKIALAMKPSVDISSVNREINTGKDSGATYPFQTSSRAFNMIPAEPASPVEERVKDVTPKVPGAWKNFGKEGNVTSIEEIFGIAEPVAVVEASPVDEISAESGSEIGSPVVQPIDEEEVSLDSIKQIAEWLRSPPPHQK